MGYYFKVSVAPYTNENAPFMGKYAMSGHFGPIKGPTAPVVSNVIIAGDPVVGKTINANYNYFDQNGDKEIGSEYKWLYSGEANGEFIEIEGATGKMYVVPAELKDKYIKFEVTPKTNIEPTTGEICYSDTIGPIKLLPTAPTALNVSISGNKIVGETLTGEYTYFDANGDIEYGTTYKWLRGTTPTGKFSVIKGAAGRIYKLTSADKDKYIKFEVLAKTKISPKYGKAVSSEESKVISERVNCSVILKAGVASGIDPTYQILTLKDMGEEVIYDLTNYLIYNGQRIEDEVFFNKMKEDGIISSSNLNYYTYENNLLPTLMTCELNSYGEIDNIDIAGDKIYCEGVKFNKAIMNFGDSFNISDGTVVFVINKDDEYYEVNNSEYFVDGESYNIQAAYFVDGLARAVVVFESGGSIQ